MRVAIMGAGGVGGFYGTKLARHGIDVTFVARGAHLNAIRKSGLTIAEENGETIVKPASAMEDTSGADPRGCYPVLRQAP